MENRACIRRLFREQGRGWRGQSAGAHVPLAGPNTDPAASGTESEQFCVYQGANLASVHSTAEYNFIQKMVMIQTGGFPRAWIGGYDLAQEGLWLCSDGSRFDFTNWSKGQRDNYQGKQNCLYFNYGAEKRWDEGICSTRFPSVCSRRM
ncbi:unnamed protein product [Oncorhynchus mykiss]|uniref:C-type lectin domain-containing protein n=1 Tax=Oncorhynchus mykiss TaxID=8022 RepID=A0A060X211_ONCMY|nr:unnamed protein product [Oncorhynchus mykiss]